MRLQGSILRPLALFYGCGGTSDWAFCGLLTDHFHEWVRQLQLGREGGEYVE
jgi:hypothetical protein